jgi:Ser/Thr protein kinase RdoA (MazF antagonist)
MKLLTPESRAISQGRHAELYALAPGRVLKLFRAGYSRSAAEAELRHARGAHEAGIPTPRPEKIIESNGRTGIVFERCEGPTLFRMIVEGSVPPLRLAQVFFGLQRAIHAVMAPAGFPDLKERLAVKIAHARRASPALRRRTLEALADVPAGSAACHGDFHPANVIMAAGGPVVVDWLDAGRGDAALDVARSLLLLRTARPGQVDERLRAAFVDGYAGCVRQAWPERMQAIERWLPLLAMARLAEAEEEVECKQLLQMVSTMPGASPS